MMAMLNVVGSVMAGFVALKMGEVIAKAL